VPAPVDLVAFADPSRAAPGPALAARDDVDAAQPRLGPLPHARREVEAIARLFPGARTFVGEDATEAHFFAEAPRARRLHVAAHAIVEAGRPEFSSIALAPESAAGPAPSRADGWLQAFEVQGTPLAAELVTLSACESARGPVRGEEGPIGLARAFQLAGAERLLVSLWPVDDAATAEFMAEFYTRLQAGASAAGALRATKQQWLRTPPRDGDAGAPRGVAARPASEMRRDAAAWAAFVLVGARER
jgi:CHAT domain-containing protein